MGVYLISNFKDLNRPREEFGELEKALSKLKSMVGKERKTNIIVYRGFKDEDVDNIAKNFRSYTNVNCVDDRGNKLK